MGVTSLIALICKPASANERMAASRPEPGPFTLTSTLLRPKSMASFAALLAACWAA